MKKLFQYLLVAMIATMLTTNLGCKRDFLNAKPSTDILQPNSLADLEALLYSILPYTSPGLPTLSADEYQFISYPVWQSARRATERNAYLWARDIFEGETAGQDWSAPYQAIFYTNNVLAGLDRIRAGEKDLERWNSLRGIALFKRAFAYYELVSCFSKAYDPATAATDLGVPIKLSPSIDDIVPRSSVQQTYDQIIADLTAALPLLSAELPGSIRDKPSKIAAHALFARIYLSMRRYESAEAHADAALVLYDRLIDYNTISQTSNEPFSKTNDELIYFKMVSAVYSSITTVNNTYTRINPTLISSYETNDLRALVYFARQNDGQYTMKYQYAGATGVYAFSGLACDELYLIKSECAIRRHDIQTSLRYLNNLLIKRFKTNSYSPVSNLSEADILKKILLERRKELVWRNIRWSDLKRLNLEGADITLTRTLNGQTYTLAPNDPKYIFPIPSEEIALSGIAQNIR